MPLAFLHFTTTKRVQSIWYMTLSHIFSSLEIVYRHEFVYYEFDRTDLIPTNSQSYIHEFIPCSMFFWEIDLVIRRNDSYTNRFHASTWTASMQWWKFIYFYNKEFEVLNISLFWLGYLMSKLFLLLKVCMIQEKYF